MRPSPHEHLVADAGVLRPEGNQTPLHSGTEAFGFLRVLPDDRNHLRGSDVVARAQFLDGVDVEAFGEFIGAGQAVAATHEEEYSWNWMGEAQCSEVPRR